MTYSLSWTSSPGVTSAIIIPDGTKNDPLASGTTSLTLTGKGFQGWGEPLQQNLLDMLQNFASSTGPVNPILGQVWFNSDPTQLRLSVDVGTGWPGNQLAWRDITTRLAPYITGDLYFSNDLLQVYDGAAWSALAFQSQVQGNYSVTTGLVNHYVVVLSPAITAYTSNFAGTFKVGITNTGSCTLDAGAGAVALVTNKGNALQPGDLVQNDIISYLFVESDNVAYITNIIKSDSTFANTSGDSNQNFNVKYALNSSEATPLSQVQLMTQGSGVPTGTIIDFAGPPSNIPTGYIQCPNAPHIVNLTDLVPGDPNGVTYAALGAAVSTNWGTSGPGTFGIPYFPVDYAAVQSDVSTPDVGSLSTGAVKAHTHSAPVPYVTSNTSYSGGGQGSFGGGAGTLTTNTQSPAGNAANLAAGMRVLKCVKYI